MTSEKLGEVLSQYKLLFLDTMVFSYQLADHPRYAPLTSVVLDAVESGRLAAVTTTITLAELMTGAGHVR